VISCPFVRPSVFGFRLLLVFLFCFCVSARNQIAFGDAIPGSLSEFRLRVTASPLLFWNRLLCSMPQPLGFSGGTADLVCLFRFFLEPCRGRSHRDSFPCPVPLIQSYSADFFPDDEFHRASPFLFEEELPARPFSPAVVVFFPSGVLTYRRCFFSFFAFASLPPPPCSFE